MLIFAFTVTALGQGTKNGATAGAPQAQPSAPTIASALDHEISGVERQIVDVAEAMPEDKYNFSPETLNIPGADYRGVRTFAVQVKHVAASNYFIWSPLTGDKLPDGLKDRQFTYSEAKVKAKLAGKAEQKAAEMAKKAAKKKEMAAGVE